MPAFHLPPAAAYVVITAVTATLWSLQTWLIRVFIRVKIHRPLAWDDLHCGIATVFAVLESCLTIAQTGLGLGHHIPSVALQVRVRQELFAWVATLFFVLAVGFSMLSVSFLIARVTRRTSQVGGAYAIAGLTALWMGASCCVVAFQCQLPRPWIVWPRTGCIDIVSTSVVALSSGVVVLMAFFRGRRAPGSA